jgi:hypothetical protein
MRTCVALQDAKQYSYQAVKRWTQSVRLKNTGQVRRDKRDARAQLPTLALPTNRPRHPAPCIHR